MCLFPKLIRNPKYRVNKKNGGQVPPMIDKRVQYVPIGCGYCMECAAKKAREWKIRLAEDIKVHKNGKFITLTFSSEAFLHIAKEVNKKQKKPKKGYTLDNAIATYAVRHFLERWRRKYKKSVRHWLITELGGKGTENVHLHGIIWTDDIKEIERIWNNGTIPYGFVHMGKRKNGKLINYVSERTVNYITKYVTKIDPLHRSYKPKILCSKGIGRNYLQSWTAKKSTYKENGETKEYYRSTTGHKMGLPIYYRNHLYTDEEREKLWIEKLDSGIRWIGGEKVDANNEKEIQGLLKYYQEMSTKMGYGSPISWSTMQYEQERREMKHVERMEKLMKKTEAKCYYKKGTTGPKKRQTSSKAFK